MPEKTTTHKKWVPKWGEGFWFIGTNWKDVFFLQYWDNDDLEYFLSSGNYFKTAKDANQAVKEIKKIFNKVGGHDEM